MTTLRADIPHVWDIDGEPVGVRHELELEEGGVLVVRDLAIDAAGQPRRGPQDVRRLNFIKVVHALLNMSQSELDRLELQTSTNPLTLYAGPGGENSEAPTGQQPPTPFAPVIVTVVESHGTGTLIDGRWEFSDAPESAVVVLDRSPGARQFATPDEVDEYIKGERDSWERDPA